MVCGRTRGAWPLQTWQLPLTQHTHGWPCACLLALPSHWPITLCRGDGEAAAWAPLVPDCASSATHLLQWGGRAC